jgi:hypothetical protein
MRTPTLDQCAGVRPHNRCVVTLFDLAEELDLVTCQYRAVGAVAVARTKAESEAGPGLPGRSPCFALPFRSLWAMQSWPRSR